MWNYTKYSIMINVDFQNDTQLRFTNTYIIEKL